MNRGKEGYMERRKMGANYITLAAMANWLIPQITLKEGKGGGKGGEREC